jgi:hypothetical protein
MKGGENAILLYKIFLQVMTIVDLFDIKIDHMT